eukprot:TRINITY_DN43826_c0_g1_i1.p1 TRINITY_DN43826_c0_g1~~TRINITY_DN43826_c0_g1_i1.p1  ORF type:complete len:242 (+),score=42.21 TRINITY_DN43826_c0_g1_i1:73-726(+)
MAINPTLAQDDSSRELFPLPAGGESFILKRDGIAFECKLQRGGSLWGRGCFFLSSKRIVFVATEKSSRSDFKSFEIPLRTLGAPKFNQPIFGANYLSGLASPLEEENTDAASLTAGSTAFTLTFNSGGCGTFLPCFYQLLAEAMEQQQASLTQAAAEGRLNQVAFVDPSDPSVLYLSQPAPVPNSQQVTPFQIEEPSAPPAEASDTRRQGDQGCCLQ